MHYMTRNMQTPLSLLCFWSEDFVVVLSVPIKWNLNAVLDNSVAAVWGFSMIVLLCTDKIHKEMFLSVWCATSWLACAQSPDVNPIQHLWDGLELYCKPGLINVGPHWCFCVWMGAKKEAASLLSLVNQSSSIKNKIKRCFKNVFNCLLDM